MSRAQAALISGQPLAGDLVDMDAGVVRVAWQVAPSRSDVRDSGLGAVGAAWLRELAAAYPVPERVGGR
jgi:hypothetical protein